MRHAIKYIFHDDAYWKALQADIPTIHQSILKKCRDLEWQVISAALSVHFGRMPNDFNGLTIEMHPNDRDKYNIIFHGRQIGMVKSFFEGYTYIVECTMIN